MTLLSTPQSRDWKGVPGADFNSANLARDIALLPTPAVNDMGAAYTPETWDEWTATMKAKHNNGNGHGPSLNVEVQRVSADSYLNRLESMHPDATLQERIDEQRRLLPTPTRRDHKDTEVRREPHRPDDVDTLARALTDVLMPTARATDGTKGGPNQRGSSGDLMLSSAVQSPNWGEYEAAIRRWEALTRPVPHPTKPNAKGNPKLSDDFDEWFMGYPAGWITDVPGVTWNETLKACGNGVVPQQGAEGLRYVLTLGRAA